jgi:hypothetical protein
MNKENGMKEAMDKVFSTWDKLTDEQKLYLWIAPDNESRVALMRTFLGPEESTPGYMVVVSMCVPPRTQVPDIDLYYAKKPGSFSYDNYDVSLGQQRYA